GFVVRHRQRARRRRRLDRVAARAAQRRGDARIDAQGGAGMANDQGLGYTLTRRAALSPAQTALIYRDERWTYAELNALTNRVAHGLHALGVNPGDRVGF